MQFDVMNIVYFLAVILLSTKLLGICARKLGLPQVVGMVIAGLLIGPAIIGRFGWSFQGLIAPTEAEMDVLQSFSQIGTILILFSSGLETDLREMKKSGFASSMIALAGVIVPMLLGTVVSLLFMGGFSAALDQHKLLNAIFVGVILAATSVGITVETLRELGRLNTPIGTTILSAAIIDDIIGIIALSIVTGLHGGGNILITLLKAAGFFLFSIAVGLPVRKLFQYLEETRPHKRRTGIFGIALCFFFAYAAEKFFGVAAITGAFMAGLVLSGLHDTDYMDRKVLINGYMIFSPIFFAFIGISADFSMFRPSDLLFGAAIVAVGILGKLIGCGGTARLFGYNKSESLTIGYGMIARGEVALAVYSTGSALIYKGASGEILGVDPLVATIMLIVITSIACPICLKFMFRKSGNATAGNSAADDNSDNDSTAVDEAQAE